MPILSSLLNAQQKQQSATKVTQQHFSIVCSKGAMTEPLSTSAST